MKVFWKVMLRVLNKYKGWWLNSGGEMGGRKPTNRASKLKYAYMFKMQSFPNCIKMWPFFVKSDIFFFVSPKYSHSWSGIIWCLCRSSPPALTDWAEGHSTLPPPRDRWGRCSCGTVAWTPGKTTHQKYALQN